MPSIRATALAATFAAVATPALADVTTAALERARPTPPTLAADRPPHTEPPRLALRQRCVRETIRVWSDYPNRFETRRVTICWPHP